MIEIEVYRHDSGDGREYHYAYLVKKKGMEFLDECFGWGNSMESAVRQLSDMIARRFDQRRLLRQTRQAKKKAVLAVAEREQAAVDMETVLSCVRGYSIPADREPGGL